MTLLSKGSLLAVAMTALPGLGSAAILQISYTGEVVQLTNFGVPGAFAIGADISVGDAVAGTIVYDSTAGASSTTATSSDYPALSFAMSVGGFSYTAGAGNIFVGDDNMAGSSAPLRDSVIISAYSPTGPAVAGQTADRLQFSVGGTDTSILSNTDLVGGADLLALLAVDTLGGNTSFLAFANGDTARYQVTGLQVTDITPSEVPLPAGLPLLMAGLGALTALRRRKARTGS
jgi:hypothetical protein